MAVVVHESIDEANVAEKSSMIVLPNHYPEISVLWLWKYDLASNKGLDFMLLGMIILFMLLEEMEVRVGMMAMLKKVVRSFSI